MRRRLMVVFFSVLLALPLAGGVGFGLMYYSVSNPKAQDLPLALHLVALDSSEGQSYLASAGMKADYGTVDSSFETQQKGSWCGVASSVTVLNALGGRERLDQEGFFTPEASEVRGFWRVTFGGMTVDELGRLLEVHGAAAEVHHAGDTTVDGFRVLAAENLARKGDYVLVNYHRAELGQEGGGHISPLAAYDDASDRFLVMDVASYKYPPVWVEADKLFAAMNTVDPTSGLTRGFVLVTR